MLIHDNFYCKGNFNYYKFRNITDRLNKRQNVEFALYCAKDVFHLVKEENKENVKLCIDLVDKWLENENSVTSDELKTAANVVYYVWNTTDAASDAADAAYSAIYAASAAYSARAAHAAWAAAWAAVYAARAYAESNKLNEYLIIANSYLTKTNINCLNYEIEGKILFLIDELEENIIVHKDKYYVNMNGIENCPEYGFDTQEKLLNELLNSECLFWEFVRNWLDRLYKDQQA